MKLRSLMNEGSVPDKKKYIIRESFKYIRTQMDLLERELDSDYETFSNQLDDTLYGIEEKMKQMKRNLEK